MRHSRLGHPCKNTLLKALLHCNVSFDANKESFTYVACHPGKEHKLSFPNSMTQYSAPLQLVVIDVWGPALAERALGLQLRTIQTDGGGEFQVLKRYLAQHRITQRFIYPYTSAQNSLVERKHSQIVETGLSMPAHASMPVIYWNDAFISAVYLINRLPFAPLGYISLFEKLFQTKPSYSHLRIFDCLCFPNLRPYNTHKLQFRSTPSTFLGYSSLHKGYRCQASDAQVYISRHVIFHETMFPFRTSNTKSTLLKSQPQSNSKLLILSPRPKPHTQTSNVSMTIIPFGPLHITDLPYSPVLTHSTSNNPVSHSSHSSSSAHIQPPPTVPKNSHTMVIRSKVGIFKPKAYLSTTACSTPDTPADIHATMAHRCWKDTIHDELHALVRNYTWSLCTLPLHRKTIGCKWMFKVKKKVDGAVERYKARLVANGFS
ncbi:Retrovirus-related Pol polyprotein from transposon TNT 1-94 [Gossypium australe]|uniref:Retrovirus-related Pol polyprotein from transposon TNT 1-94 n=1 Tax=Gossypium australe TaxID=47621 RepID=A0A5B6W0C7_9ROSI|nr:Retrovirus-related Pol polyprotein from transposon TNT 1-94 [Gossypium australe]